MNSNTYIFVASSVEIRVEALDEPAARKALMEKIDEAHALGIRLPSFLNFSLIASY